MTTPMERWVQDQENLEVEEDGSITNTETGSNTAEDDTSDMEFTEDDHGAGDRGNVDGVDSGVQAPNPPDPDPDPAPNPTNDSGGGQDNTNTNTGGPTNSGGNQTQEPDPAPQPDTSGSSDTTGGSTISRRTGLIAAAGVVAVVMTQ